MNDYKEELMLTEIVQPQPKGKASSETDLTTLAEHLSMIADALRQKTHGDAPGAPAHQETATPLNSSRTAVVQLAPAPQLEPASSAPGAIYTDIRSTRLQYGELAREAYAKRRRRCVIFDNDELFGEPAWDILLDLYVANVENKSVSVSSACIGSAAPPTTGLRWLGVLSEQGLILREHDPEDQRRVLVRLTEKGLMAMDEYFASLAPRP